MLFKLAFQFGPDRLTSGAIKKHQVLSENNLRIEFKLSDKPFIYITKRGGLKIKACVTSAEILCPWDSRHLSQKKLLKKTLGF